MGAVYKAEHLAMAQPVAIKMLLTESAADPSMVKRFVQEARSCFRIDHPNCVRVTDFGAAADGSLYFAMEYLDGRTIGLDLHIDGPMTSPRVRHVAAQVADALTHAHGHGIIHRDLKPANIMLLQRDGDPDFVKVFDFGLGKLVDQGARLTGLTMSPLTQDGIVFGTPEYMSPEQAKGQPLSPASDVYTLGVCCYEMLTGELPFLGKTFTETLSKHVTETPVAPSVAYPALAIDPLLEALVMQCLEKEAQTRPGTKELAAALRKRRTAETSAASTLASSETMVVSEESMASIATSVVEHSLPPAPSKKSSDRRYLYRVGAVLIVGGIALAIAMRGERSSDKASEEPRSAPVAACDAGVAASPTPTPADAGPANDARTPVDASPASAKRPSANRKVTVDEHLEAAEKAHRAGNVLKQLSEAQASLRANPRKRRAAFLVGDALSKSGDKVAACTYFRRAGKRHARTAGCSD